MITTLKVFNHRHIYKVSYKIYYIMYILSLIGVSVIAPTYLKYPAAINITHDPITGVKINKVKISDSIYFYSFINIVKLLLIQFPRLHPVDNFG